MEKRDAIPAAIFFAVMVLAWFIFLKPTMETVPPGSVPPSSTTSIYPGSTTVPTAGTGTSVAPGTTTTAVGTDSGVATTLPVAGAAGTEGADGGPAPVAGADAGTPTTGTAAVLADTMLLPEYAALTTAAPVVTLVRTDVLDLMIDPEAGGVIDAVVYDYKNESRKGPMELGSIGVPMYSIGDIDSSWTFSHALVEFDPAKPDKVTFSRQVLGTKIVISQTFALTEETPYSLSYHVTLRNLGTETERVQGMTLNAGVMLGMDTPKGFMGSAGEDQRVDLRLTGKDAPKSANLSAIEKWNANDSYKYKDLEVDWAAVQNKYFASILAGEEPFVDSKLFTQLQDPADATSHKLISALLVSKELSLPAQTSQTLAFEIYVGPKKFELLQSMTDNEKSIMHFDLFLFFHFVLMEKVSLLIFWAITTFNGFLGGYGLAIVCVTIIIRSLFFPLTHRSTMLTKRMQKLQPEVAALREQYADDPQRLNMKVMELYRQKKVSPLGGCLPMVVQIPVFFALFNVLRSAIELRHQEFLWVTDLSMPDTLAFQPFGLPINPLAILMGVTMMLQQKMTPTTPDPMQARMMMIMSLGFMFMLYSMPSGLTLYWTTNQVCAIIQYQITNRFVKNDDDEAPTAGAAQTPAKA